MKATIRCKARAGKGQFAIAVDTGRDDTLLSHYQDGLLEAMACAVANYSGSSVVVSTECGSFAVSPSERSERDYAHIKLHHED